MTALQIAVNLTYEPGAQKLYDDALAELNSLIAAERTAAELREQLRRACDIAGIIDGDANTLTDWIVGAQSEIAGMAAQLRDIWDMQQRTFERTAPIDWRNEYNNETPLGQALDGIGDEVEP